MKREFREPGGIPERDEQEQLTEIIVNRPRESGVQGAMQRYMESRQIYQSLQNLPAQSLKASKQNILPPINDK